MDKRAKFSYWPLSYWPRFRGQKSLVLVSMTWSRLASLLPSGTFSQTLNLADFAAFSQVLSSLFDRRPSPVAVHQDGCDAARRARSSAIAETYKSTVNSIWRT